MCGVDVYARDPSTRVLMLWVKLDDGEPLVWYPHLRPDMPAKLRAWLLDPNIKIVAHNAAFERLILKHVLKIDLPASRFICTMAMAFSLALPGNLDQLTRDALRLHKDYQKDPRGKALINLFCKPRPKNHVTAKNPREFNDWDSHPAEWAEFCGYGRQDVVAEDKVFRVLRQFFPNFGEVFELWAFDQDINDEGYPVDLELVHGAIAMAKQWAAMFKAEMIKVSGLKNPNSTQQAQPWLAARGYPFESLRKDRVKLALADFGDKITKEAKDFLALRTASTKTSLKKFDAMLRAVADDGILRYTMQFCGAGRTGRWAGRVVQLQNLPRPVKRVEPHLGYVRQLIRDRDFETLEFLFGNVLDVLVSSIRSAFIAPAGKVLNVCDLSAIELCVIAWITGCKFWLDVLEKKLDPYKAFGVHYLVKPYDEITKDERNECKPAALGCGYRLGGGDLVGEYPDQKKTGLWAYAESMGVKLSREASHKAVAIYRNLSPEVKQMWYDLENAMRDCIRDKEPRRVGMFLFDIKPPFLRIRLPSGRHLFYCRPAVKKIVKLWPVWEIDEHGHPRENEYGQFIQAVDDKTGEPIWDEQEKWEISYEGVHQTSKKWVRMDTHGGKIIENLVQAIARDILVYGMLKAREAGYNIIGHVHDEIISLDDIDDDSLSTQALEACMSVVPPWAEGCPLSAHGFRSDFYKKD
jgi:DNA polymerase